MDGETTEEKSRRFDRASQEFHQFASRMREVYGFDAIVVLACKEEDDATESCFARSGNTYAAKHLARLYGSDSHIRKVGEE
jgi:hypothetical protein